MSHQCITVLDVQYSPPMSAHAARLARLFTTEYARRINAQIVHPAESVVIKPNELESALCRPLHVAFYEPDRPAAYLAATLSYGIIKGGYPSHSLHSLVFTRSQGTRSRMAISAQVAGSPPYRIAHVLKISSQHFSSQTSIYERWGTLG